MSAASIEERVALTMFECMYDIHSKTIDRAILFGGDMDSYRAGLMDGIEIMLKREDRMKDE